MFIEWIVHKFYPYMFPLKEGLKDYETYEYQMWYLLRNIHLQPSECLQLETDERLTIFHTEKKLQESMNGTPNIGGIS